MNKKEIIIIDSGVSNTNSHLKDADIQGFCIHKDMTICDDIHDEYGHGTAIYGIIKSVSDIANIINIKIPNIQNGIDPIDLVKVLEYIYINFTPDIINMSLGVSVCEDHDLLYDICKKFNQRGTIIVAAFDNSGAYSYPAAYDCVIGVVTHIECTNSEKFIYFHDKTVNVAANGNIQRLLWNNPEVIFLGGNSFACAHITCIIAKILSEGTSDIYQDLKQRAILKCKFDKQKSTNQPKIPFTIKRAALFPFSKEMHSLVRYSHILDFKITDVYDVRYSSKVHASTNILLGESLSNDYTIKDIRNISWDNIDTLIIGHLEQLEVICKEANMLEKLVKQAMENNIKVVSFDPITSCGGNKKSYYYPIVNKSMLEPNRFGMLYRISKPVLSIMGTSSKQGKFTLQLKLREMFLKNNINVGQIGTEPTALLFNMDYVFPMGYGDSVHIEGNDVIRYLNSLIHNLCTMNKDIILIGSQSNTIPYDMGNLKMFTLKQITFLLGTQPDAVILCINPYDDVDYIKSTINFIESLSNTKVIALVVFPVTLKNMDTGIYGGKKLITKETYQILKKNLEANFNLSAYRLDDNVDMELLYAQICEYFS
ncbi:MAG: DUF1611 domain-containing protein [Clostridiales bacterium]|nr:DUF1611 domain-containing protein [Clostridiales bacterium]